MKVDAHDALENSAMVVFTSLLGHDSDVIRHKAARDIMDLRYQLIIMSRVLGRFYYCSKDPMLSSGGMQIQIQY